MTTVLIFGCICHAVSSMLGLISRGRFIYSSWPALCSRLKCCKSVNSFQTPSNRISLPSCHMPLAFNMPQQRVPFLYSAGRTFPIYASPIALQPGHNSPIPYAESTYATKL